MMDPLGSRAYRSRNTDLAFPVVEIKVADTIGQCNVSAVAGGELT
jgi:hypothetical protein